MRQRYFIAVLDGEADKPEEPQAYRLLGDDYRREIPFESSDLNEVTTKAGNIRSVQPWRKAIVLQQIDP